MDIFIFGFVVIAVLVISFGCYVYLTNKIIKEQERELSETKRKLNDLGRFISSLRTLEKDKDIHFGGF